MTTTSQFSRTIAIAISFAALLAAVPAEAEKGRGEAKREVNSNRNTNVNSNKNVNVNSNKNVNVNSNKNVNVNVDVDRHGGCCYNDHHHPVAMAAAVVATAVVVGSIVNTLPPSCTVVMINGFAYQQCGNTWYQPQISGSSTTYVVINAPR